VKKHIEITNAAAAARFLTGTLLLAILMSVGAGTSRAAMQFIPSLGLSKSTDSNAGDAKLSGGVALRAPLFTYLSAEGGITYRQESFSNDDFTVRTWPVTAYDYRSSLPYTDSTTDQVGVHLGGGLAMPLSPSLGLDLNMRYVFMQQDNSLQFPTTFNPDFWSTTLGLAIKF
jgi:hypothetical protein